MRARGLWVTAGSYSAANETDGRIPRHILRTLGGTPADAKALCEAGLWREVKAGWIFHEWSLYQPDAASRKAKRQAGLDSGAWGNHKRWHEARDINVPDCEYCQGMPPGFPTAPAIDEPHDPEMSSGDPTLTRIGKLSPPNRPVPEPDTRSNSQVGGGGNQSNAHVEPPPPPTPEILNTLAEPWRCPNHQGIDTACNHCKRYKALNKKLEADRVKAEKAAARDLANAEADRQRAEAAATPPDDGTGYAKALEAVKAARG